jgi:hypothetical protein
MIQELEKPKLKKIKMLCDTTIDDKLLKYPMVKQCFSKNNLTIICGKQGDGKTSLALQFIKSKEIYWNTFENCYCIIPEESLNSIANSPFESLDEDKVFHELTADVLDELYERVKADAMKGENSFIFIDDMQDQMKQHATEIALERLCNKIRHLHVTIFLLAQNYNLIPKKIRVKAFNVITYDIGKSQLETLFDEFIKMPKKVFNEILDVCFVEPHDWILINRGNKLYKGFDKVNLPT